MAQAYADIKRSWYAVEGCGTGRLVITLQNADTITIDNDNPQWFLNSMHDGRAFTHTHIESFLTDFATVLEEKAVVSVSIETCKNRLKVKRKNTDIVSIPTVKKLRI